MGQRKREGCKAKEGRAEKEGKKKGIVTERGRGEKGERKNVFSKIHPARSILTQGNSNLQAIRFMGWLHTKNSLTALWFENHFPPSNNVARHGLKIPRLVLKTEVTLFRSAFLHQKLLQPWRRCHLSPGPRSLLPKFVSGVSLLNSVFSVSIPQYSLKHTENSPYLDKSSSMIWLPSSGYDSPLSFPLVWKYYNLSNQFLIPIL